MKKILSILMVLVMSGFATQSFAEKKDAPLTVDGAKTINSEVVLEMMEDTEGLVIIDARVQKDRSDGQIEGAVHIVNTEVTAETLAAAIPSFDTPVIFYCNGVKCGRSSDATAKAVKAGYRNLYYFRGGIAEWKEEGLPMVK